MNLVLADTEEFRRTRRKGKAAPGAAQQVTETEERRAIGLTIIRGAQVISVSVDGPPPADPAARLGAATGGQSTAAALSAGPGVARPAGRGLPIGLTGPAPGVGGPGPGFGPPGGFPGAPGGFAPPGGFGGRGGPPGPRKYTFAGSRNPLLTCSQPVSLRAHHLVPLETPHPLAARHQVSHRVDVAAPLDLADRLRGTFKTDVLGTTDFSAIRRYVGPITCPAPLANSVTASIRSG